MDFPELRIAGCGVLGTILSLTVEDEVLDSIVQWAMDNIEG